MTGKAWNTAVNNPTHPWRKAYAEAIRVKKIRARIRKQKQDGYNQAAKERRYYAS